MGSAAICSKAAGPSLYAAPVISRQDYITSNICNTHNSDACHGNDVLFGGTSAFIDGLQAPGSRAEFDHPEATVLQFSVEQFLPCRLPEIKSTVHRLPLPDFEAPLFLQDNLFAYRMNEGYAVESAGGEFYVDRLEFLQAIHGTGARSICEDDADVRELEQLYYHGLIGYGANERGQLRVETQSERYRPLYDGVATTWFSYIPQKVELDLTNICNFQCIHCAKDASPQRESGGLSLQEYVDFIDDVGRLGLPSLTLMGGEPTCHPEFIELAVIAKYAGVRGLSTSTNGWLVDDELAAKMATLFGSVQVSIHGATPATHDAIVGRKGAFEHACQAVKLLKRHGVASLNISFTVMKHNVHEMGAMVELSRQLGVHFVRFLVLFGQGRGIALPQWTDEDKQQISDSIRKFREDGETHIEVEAGGFPPYCDITNDAAFYGCPAGRTLMYVGTQGEVKPCSATEINAGNIRDASILDLWHSEPMRRLRRKPPCDCAYAGVCAAGCLGNSYWEAMFRSSEFPVLCPGSGGNGESK